MLPVKNVIDTVSATHLDGIDLAQIEICGGSLYMRLRQTALIILIGNKVFDWDLFKMNIRDEHTVIVHLILL